MLICSELTDLLRFQISKNEFWALWFKYLAIELYGSESEIHVEHQTSMNHVTNNPKELSLTDVDGQEKIHISWYERFHARYSSSRRMKHMFLEDHIVVRNSIVA